MDGLGLVGVYYVISHSVYGLGAEGTVSEGKAIGNLPPRFLPLRQLKSKKPGSLLKYYSEKGKMILTDKKIIVPVQ